MTGFTFKVPGRYKEYKGQYYAGVTYTNIKQPDEMAQTLLTVGLPTTSLDFLAGQNMFDVFVPANDYANGKNLTQFDENINLYWRDQARMYSVGEKSRDDAITSFKQTAGYQP